MREAASAIASVSTAAFTHMTRVPLGLLMSLTPTPTLPALDCEAAQG